MPDLDERIVGDDASSVVTALAHAIAELPSPEALAALRIEAFESIAGDATRVVVFGCGHLGQLARVGAIAAGFRVAAFADNNRRLWGTEIEGVPVMSPADAVARFNEDGAFIVAVYNSEAPRRQLAELGCGRIIPYVMFFWRFADCVPAEDRLELPHRVLAHTEAVFRGFQALSDARSREEFVAQIRWRCTLDYACLPHHDSHANMYYARDLFVLGREEVFVDCGAYDGDSIRSFLRETDGYFAHIVAVEPDPKNRVALLQYVDSLGPEAASRISVVPYGLGDNDGVVTFASTGTVGSRIVGAASGGDLIECRRLDTILRNRRSSFIKMDIEGSEPLAIIGATAAIRSARPIIAACAYHRCEHLWMLPILMTRALPDYQVFLRRYAEECWETVYYAVPPERRPQCATGVGAREQMEGASPVHERPDEVRPQTRELPSANLGNE